MASDRHSAHLLNTSSHLRRGSECRCKGSCPSQGRSRFPRCAAVLLSKCLTWGIWQTDTLPNWVSNSACQIHAVLHCSSLQAHSLHLDAILGEWKGKRRIEPAVNFRDFFQFTNCHHPSHISPSNIFLWVKENHTSRHCLLLREMSTILVQG